MNKALYIIIVFVLLMTAIIIRIPPQDSNEDKYAGDEGIQLLIADHIVRYRDYRLDGEISSFDKEGKYILHNSPIGYYFYTLFYVLGGQVIEGYHRVYFILNIIQALFIFAFGYFVFGSSGGLFLLVLSLFSQDAIMLASFPSQPTNAVFVESIAIGVFGWYVRSRNAKWFLVSSLLSLLATQLYPSMYLLIIPKIVLFFYFLCRTNISSVSLLIAGALGIYIYFPIMLQEYAYYGDNLRILRTFLGHPRSHIELSEIANRFVINIHILFSTINWFHSGYITWFIIFLFVLSVLYRKMFVVRHLFVLGMLLIPSALLTLHPAQPYIVAHRAYLLVILPYVWMFLGSVISGFPRRVVYVITVVIVIISLWTNAPSILDSKLQEGSSSQAIVASIAQDMKTKRVDVENIDVFVISPQDSWSWDAALYWYELERATGRRLSRIEYESSKAKRISENSVQTIFLICHRIASEDVESQCKSVFEQKRMENLYGALYRLVDARQIMGRSYFVYQQ